MKPRVLAKNLLLAAMVSALGVAGAAEKMDIGKMEYGESCAACHGVTGKGDGPFAAQLKSPVPDLTVLTKNNGGVFPALRVYNVIDGRQELLAHGTREMPIWVLITKPRALLLTTTIPTTESPTFVVASSH